MLSYAIEVCFEEIRLIDISAETFQQGVAMWIDVNCDYLITYAYFSRTKFKRNWC